MASDVNFAEAERQNFIHKIGTTLSGTIKFWLDAAKTLPDDISTDEFFMDVKHRASGKVLLSFALGSGFAKADVQTLQVSKTAAQTRITKGEHDYDILRRKVDGTVTIVRFGTFWFYEKITEIPA